QLEGVVVAVGHLVPWQRLAAVGVVTASQAQLVAVVDARGSRHHEQQEEGLPGSYSVAPQGGEHAWRVVRAEQVQLARHGLLWVTAQQPGDAVREAGCAQRRYAVESRAGQLAVIHLPAHQPEDRARERVVHHPVEHVALQPARGVIPDLADQVSVQSYGSTTRPELAP